MHHDQLSGLFNHDKVEKVHNQFKMKNLRDNFKAFSDQHTSDGCLKQSLKRVQNFMFALIYYID